MNDLHHRFPRRGFANPWNHPFRDATNVPDRPASAVCCVTNWPVSETPNGLLGREWPFWSTCQWPEVANRLFPGTKKGGHLPPETPFTCHRLY